MLKRLTILAVLAVSAALAPSVQASGEPPTEEKEGRTAANPYTSPLGLAVRSSDGYDLLVSAAQGGRVRVEASGTDGSITYSAPGSVSESGIHADFGKYGRIEMRWVPNGRIREVRHKCREGGVIKNFYDAGSYVGILRFRGGGDFTSVDVRRVTWRRSWYSSAYPCGFLLGTDAPGAGVVVEAGRRGHISTPVHLFVYRPHLGAEVEFRADVDQAGGRIEIHRHAFAEGGSQSLALAAANGTTTATISPPSPFYGQATFERSRRAEGTLTGELGVEFPDHTKVGLAGAGFEAALRLESINITPE